VDETQALRNELRALLDSLTERMEERFDASADLSKERHAENVTRLGRIELEVRMTNGRVTRNEEQIRTLQETKGCPLSNGMAQIAGKNEAVTLERLRWYLVVAGSSIGGTIALLKLVGKL